MILVHFKKYSFLNRFFISVISSINFVSNLVLVIIMFISGSFALILAFIGLLALSYILYKLYSESKLYIFKVVNIENEIIKINFMNENLEDSLDIRVENLILEVYNSGPGLARSTNIVFFDNENQVLTQSCCGSWEHSSLHELANKLKSIGCDIRII